MSSHQDTKQTAPAAPGRRGRPATAEPWKKVTVVLMDREVVFLDRLTADMRAASGNAVSRAHLIRALIDALAESDIDLSDIQSAPELRARLGERLGHPRDQ